MIARELEEFFAGCSPRRAAGRSSAQGPATPRSSRTSTPATPRGCWRQIRFRDVPYAEDQAFARDLLGGRLAQGLPPRRGGAPRARLPAAASSCAATSTSTAGCAQTTRPRRAVRGALDGAARARAGRGATAAGCSSSGVPAAERRRAGPRARPSTTRGRRVFSALGSPRRPRSRRAVRRRLSLEGRGTRPRRTARRRRRARTRRRPRVTHVAGTSPGAYAPPRDGTGASGAGPAARPGPRHGRSAQPLHLAVVVPPFGRGQRRAQHDLPDRRRARAARAHVLDLARRPLRHQQDEQAGRAAPSEIREWFAPFEAARLQGLRRDWYGADVAIATGWQTVYPALRARPSAARGPTSSTTTSREFYATSVERTARRATPTTTACTASPPARGCATCCRALRRDRRAVPARRRPRRSTARGRSTRRRDTVVFYARRTTAAPRRAARAAGARGAHAPPAGPAGRAVRRPTSARGRVLRLRARRRAQPDAARVALLARRRVGLCLSLTNYSLMPQEMLACGLPCVELAGYQRRVGLRRRRRRSSSRRSTRTRWPTRCERLLDDARAWAAPLARRHRVRRGPHVGPWRPTRSRPACAPRCASGRRCGGRGLSVEARDHQELTEEAVGERQRDQNGTDDGAPAAPAAARGERDGGGVEGEER